MNKAEKKVEQYKLEQEQAVLKDLERHYAYALKGILERVQVLQAAPETQSKVYQLEYQKTMQRQVSAILDRLQADTYTTLDQYRHDAYTTGFVGTMFDLHSQGVPVLIPINQDAVLKAVQHDTMLTSPLYDELGIGTKKMKKSINMELSRGLASGLTYDDIARNIRNTTKAPLARCKNIARTEGHRIQQASAQDAAVAAKAKGADVVKQWDSTLDGDTRPNHRQLDGQIREVEEPFEVGGYKPMHPGDFGAASEDCNCRCVCLTRARAALDEDELKVLKDRAEALGVDKSEEFADFEKKYLKAADSVQEEGQNVAPKTPPKTAEPVDNSGKSGIINTRGIAQRTMSNGLRTSPFHILTEEEIDSVIADAKALGIPRSILRFNEKNRTGFYDGDELIYIRGDVLPDRSSNVLRDLLTPRAVLAHEYYGHYKSHPSKFEPEDWRDEFMASYKAAINAPNLSDSERRMLMLDAYDRAKEAGVKVVYNKEARRIIYGYE